MSWKKAPKEAEACKDFAERALKRIAELEAENARLMEPMTGRKTYRKRRKGYGD